MGIGKGNNPRSRANLARNEAVDLMGQTFGRLAVFGRAENQSGKAHWWCVCDCGNFYSVRGRDLRVGRTTQCRSCVATEQNLRRPKAERLKAPKTPQGVAVSVHWAESRQALYEDVEVMLARGAYNLRHIAEGIGMTKEALWRALHRHNRPLLERIYRAEKAVS